jgi:hypothetical protein
VSYLRKVAAGAACVGLLLAAGCASLDPLDAHRKAAAWPVSECAEWYSSLDAAVDAAGVRDVQAARISGFPYLRVDRFTAALRESAHRQESAMHALIDRMLALDLEARTAEIANLPIENLKAAWNGMGEAEVSASVRQTRECGRHLSGFDREVGRTSDLLLDRVQVPDDYVTAYRVAGLYPLARIPFTAGIRRHIDETNSAFARDLDAPTRGVVVRYSPANRPHLSAERLRDILERSHDNPLRVPEPTSEDLALLFALYAPSFEVDTTGDYDRPGGLRWRWGALPEVDATEPAVYRQSAHTRYRGMNLLQLVYTVWFPERPADSPGDLLAGKLDGVVFRVTLAPDGTPLLYDTMHPCGCYHMFFTTPRATLLPQPEGEPEWAFVPQKLRAMTPRDRIVVRIASRTHYVERVIRDQDDSLARYELRPYDDLRSLPRMRGGSQSVFGPDAMVAGTGRLERFVFWPMGVANAGAMRQWGHHATAFVGRRHFDDADLLERRFLLDLK